MTSISSESNVTTNTEAGQPMHSLDDIEATDRAVAGVKGAGLALLRQAGFEVPDALVLPVGIAETWPAGPAPQRVREAVAAACELLGDRLAVRTSATWEDGASKAHAGMTTTVLDVGGVEDVLAAVRRCLDESTAAAVRSGLDGDLAIVLQQLVPADWAGVAFSADPLTGDRNVVRIAATAGLGDALVQGDVVGEDVVVRGDRIEPVGTVLPSDQVLAVAQAARDVETVNGCPQDIEWAISNGQLRLLQARPITVLPIEPAYPEGNNWQKDVAHYPEPITPFGWSLMKHCAQEIPAVFDAMGLLVRGLEEVSVGGEIYGRVLPAFGNANAAGSPPPAPILGLVARLAPPLRRRTALARSAVETKQAQRWLDEWLSHERAAAQLRNRTLGATDVDVLDDHALLEHLDQILDNARTGMRIHFQLLMPLARSLFRLHRFAEKHLGWDDSTMMAMFAGQSPATRAAHDALASIRNQTTAIDGAAEALAAAPTNPLSVLREIDVSLAVELEAWMNEHGWAMVNYDAGVPVLAERPATITQLVLHDASDEGDDVASELIEKARSELSGERLAEFNDLLADAQAVYPVREDNTIILGDRPMALARRCMLEISNRLVARGDIESIDDGAYLAIDELRSALQQDNHEVLKSAVAHRRGEEAWVRANPGPLYIGKQSNPPDVSRLPKALRDVNEPILWMISHEYPTPAEPPTGKDVLLAGVAAAAGTAEGTVRVIRGHDEIALLQPGDVLVCQVTSPAWAPLFPLASAIVADGGGVLSHAAIAAREHGIPAVLGTGTGTSELVDGQRVVVDGTRGLVLKTDQSDGRDA